MKTKDQFLVRLESELAPLPPEEREELMEDYRSHFMFGLQNGKTEEEIAGELGDPREIAQEALHQRSGSSTVNAGGATDPVFWYYGQEPRIDSAAAQGGGKGGGAYPGTYSSAYSGANFGTSPGSRHPEPEARRRSAAVWVCAAAGLFFLNIVMIPVLLALWSAVIGIAAGGVGGVLSPVALLLDYWNTGTYFPAKGFASMSLAGCGILLLILTKLSAGALYKLSANYAGWNIRAMRGRGRAKHD